MKQKKYKTAHGCLQALAAPVIVLFLMVTVPITLVTSFSGMVTNRATFKRVINLDSTVRLF